MFVEPQPGSGLDKVHRTMRKCAILTRTVLG
jgi:hypothetical protein